MMCIFALVKKNWLRVLEQSEIADKVEIKIPHLAVDYEPHVSLDEDEWFKLTKFNERGYPNQLCQNPKFNTVYDGQVHKKDLSNMTNLKSLAFRPKEGDVIGFQSVTKRKVIRNRPLISWSLSDDPEMSYVDGVVIGNYMDAIFDVSNDILYFKRLSGLNVMFPGISEENRIADDAEVANFFNVTCASFCKLDKSFPMTNIGKPNKKRIATLIEDGVSSLDENQMNDYVKDCVDKEEYIELESKEGRFLIQNDSQLTLLINVIDGRYFENSLWGEKRMASSYRTLKPKT